MPEEEHFRMDSERGSVQVPDETAVALAEEEERECELLLMGARRGRRGK